MRLGDIAHAVAARFGKPLAGVRILALEQMASPFGTQLLARLGAVPKGLPPGPASRMTRWCTTLTVAAHRMLVEHPRTDGVEQPVLIPGNPIKLSKVTEGPDVRVPWLGEHSDQIRRDELGLSDADLGRLRSAGVIG
jgi:crotonobetainyl-CoA:carnitine CoA-transferase CaiB-like acyl-CoA transferase